MDGHGDRGGEYAAVDVTDADPVLELDGVTRAFGRETAVDDVSLTVYEGELLTLLGPSGCGKTTTLHLLAGLEAPTSGTVDVAGERAAGPDRFVSPEDRDVGLVFQDYALFPHMTVAENVAFGLTDATEAERERRVQQLLDLVGLERHHDRRPAQLSGGQQQRVALARSLAPEPEVLLLDEPFSNLDVDLRVQMREEVRAILKEAGVTAVSVTHDQEEAMSISDRVAVMESGRVLQVGAPERVFQHPESRFVAGFLGHASFLPGYVGGDAVSTDLGPIPREQIHGLVEQYEGTRIDVLVRPDDLRADRVDASAADGHVVHRRYLGPTVLYRVKLDDGDHLEVMHNHTEGIPLEAPVAVELSADHDLAWFPREMDPEEPSGTAGTSSGEPAAADGGRGRAANRDGRDATGTDD